MRNVVVLLALSLCGHLAVAQAAVGEMAGVVVVDGTKYPRTDQGITAAIAALHGAGQVRLSAGVYRLSNEIVISTPGIQIVGLGYATRLQADNPSGNVFRISAPVFRLSDLEIATTAQHGAGSIMEIESDQGLVEHVRITGDFFNGFTLAVQKAGGWNFEDIRIIGSTWNYAFLVRSPSLTVAGTSLHFVNISNAMNWKTASVVIDTGVDTFLCAQSNLGPILVTNSLHGQAPRWIRFTNTQTEGGGKAQNTATTLQIDAVRDLRYSTGGLASARFGAVIGPQARGVVIADTEFVNIFRSAVVVNAGADDVSITHNTFEDTAVEASGVYDAVSVAPGVSNINISYNAFKSTEKNRPRYDLAMPKCPSCVADGNRYGGFQGAAVAGQ